VEELISEHAGGRAREGDLNDPLRGHPASRLPTAADLAGLELPGPEISGDTVIGHVNLTVTDLERSATFYRDVLGLHVTQQDERSVFLAAGDYHHHVALNTWDSEAQARARHSAGLHHFALRLPDEAALSEVVVRILRAGHDLLGATDHGVNLAVYLVDPDGNGIELMVDRPSSQWPRTADGGIAMTVKALDLKTLVTAALAQAPIAPPQTTD
jgi:catechol 2,3-dioxygenase